MRALCVRVGTRSAAKLEAVRRGLSPFCDELCVESADVESGVSKQPLGFEEILAGARARARQSFAVGNVDLGVGIEDGLIPVSGSATGYMNVGFCVLFDGEAESLGLSAGFEYPPECVRAATGPERVPVGDAFDALFQAPAGAEDPGRGAGNIGRLTGGVLTRADYGAQAVICAYARRLHPALYDDEAR